MSNTKKAYHEGEKWCVYVIRRGCWYWSGTKWEPGEYSARLYSQVKDAQKVIERRRLADPNGYHSANVPVQIVKCTLTVGVPVETETAETTR